MSTLPNAQEHRTADHPVEDLFLKRWSPRAMSGEPVEESELMSLLEAARWAPSTYNEQEWRFLYAHREGEHWETFLGLLADANQSWCVRAGVLLVALSAKQFSRNGKPNPVHSLDTGMAVQNLLLQGARMGLVCHAMAGFDRGKTRVALGVPEDYETECMIAVGRPGEIENLPENYQEMDRQPSGRKPIGEFAAAGPFRF
jgi:nitroreductase